MYDIILDNNVDMIGSYVSMKEVVASNIVLNKTNLYIDGNTELITILIT